MGANWGKMLQLSIFGESHGKAIGINISGLPAGIKIDTEALLKEMDKRAPGKNKLTTTRNEDDFPDIISGLVDGYTTGAPICGLIYNKNHHSKDYSYLKEQMRPGHSDYSAYIKYQGFNDVRGGGHFSGRLTAPIVFAGAICKQILEKDNIYIGSHIKSIYDIEDESFPLDIDYSLIQALNNQNYPLINKDILDQMKKIINQAKINNDSVGGCIECAVIGLPAGIGEPFFNSLESQIATLMFSIPALKSLSFGKGFELSKMFGSEGNDSYYYNQNQEVKTKTNNNGGILGGISNGMPVTFTVGFKPTPSIALKQDSINVKTKENQTLEIIGRHDPCVVLRAFPIVEAMTAIAVLDLKMQHK